MSGRGVITDPAEVVTAARAIEQRWLDSGEFTPADFAERRTV